MRNYLNLIMCVLTLLVVSAASAATYLDPSFSIGTGANGIVEQALPLANGKILICGNFTTFNGANRAYVARLNSDGTVDLTFQAAASYWVRNMAVQTDGKIVIGGYFNNVGGVPRSLVARLNADGSLDQSFNPGGGATTLIAGGIDGNDNPFVFWVAVQSDGKILLTGNFRYYDGYSSQGLVRVNPDGTRDTTFNVGGGLDSWGRNIQILSNGQILVSGWFTAYNGQSYNRLVRMNPDGSADTAFKPYFGDRTAIYSTVQVAGGKTIAAGHSLNYDGLFTREFERLNADGTLDSTFVGTSNEKTESVIAQPDGKIIIGGNFTAVDGVPRKALARLNADGTLDDTLQADIDNFIWTTALQADGKLLISGGFTTVDGQSRNGIARLLTGIVPSANPAPSLGISSVNSTNVTLSWTYSGTAATGFAIESKTGANGTYAQIATTSSSARSYTAASLTPGTVYYFRVRATAASGNSSYSNEAQATTQTGIVNATATYVSTDTTTKGSWKGTYGTDGFNVFSDSSAYPPYARITPANKSDWTWEYSTTDTRALQKNSGTDRIAGCWYAPSSYSIDLSITDGQKHRLSLYALDWDQAGRVESIQISDADTSTVLDTRTVNNFGAGSYLTWDVLGHVKITVTATTGNAVLSGLFLGSSAATQSPVATPSISPNGGSYTNSQTVTLSTTTAGAELRYTLDGTDPTATSTLYSSAFLLSSNAAVKAKGFKSGMLASSTAAATFNISIPASGSSTNASAKFVFIGVDTTSKGNWSTNYGASGYQIFGGATSLPAYAQVTPFGKSDWTWTSSTTDVRALSNPTPTSRIAGCWYAASSYNIGLNFTDGATHRFSVYFCDWDAAGRSQTVELLDAVTGNILDTRTASGFSGGQYLIWDIAGKATLRITRTAGPNAAASGLFFSAPAKQL